MRANLATAFSELLFLDVIKKNTTKEVWDGLNTFLRLILLFSSIYISACTLYYGLELMTEMWNEYLVGLVGLEKTERHDVILFFLSVTCLKWIFFSPPKFKSIHNLEKIEAYLSIIVNKGVVFLLTYMAVQFY
ncbi:MAG: hypothetical protein COW78_00020 [Bdellovibrio sp. CG22_combo_CG10-13_8_21_14_all_39_27]|nr:MAG: hypothetical protein COW78_00020 [Bdellovibrio sp. CG22_combo_CG10-13_8_21_14_all_39_27]